MNIKTFLGLAASALFLAGCETTSQNTQAPVHSSSAPTLAPGKYAVYYQATDGRRIMIGKNQAADGGLTFKDPHMDKCWITDSFNFKDYDTLVVLPTKSTVTPETNAVDVYNQSLLTVNEEVTQQFMAAGLFANFVSSQSAVKPGAKVLVMENTITEFKKGSSGARFWASEFGAGQPVIRVATKITDADKVVFSCEARRSGVSARSRTLPMHDADIQRQDIHSLVLDLTDFIAVIEGKYQPRE